MPQSQKPVVHVVFGLSAAGSLREAIEQLGLDQTVIGLADDLSYGPIDAPAAGPRVEWIAETLGYDGFAEWEEPIDLFWKQATDSDVLPVAWVSRRCASEYSGFLEFVRRIGEQPFRVVDITDIEFAWPSEPPGPQTWIAPTFGVVGVGLMIDAGLIDRQTTLSETEIEAYRSTWEKLRAENAAFRVVTGQGLFSAPITHFDDIIRSSVTNDWQRCTRVVHAALGKLSEDNFRQCGDLVLWSRVTTLVDEGVLEMQGDEMWMSKSSVRLPS